MAFTQDLFTSRRNTGDGNIRIGQRDRIWYDSNTNTLRIGDGVTPGGVVISGGGALAQIQSDWTQTDTSRVDYIKNKPDVGAIQTIIADTGEPMGFVNRPDSVISFDNGSRSFSISPLSTSYTIYTRGVKRTITDTRSVSIPNTTGLYYIYFDTNGVLQYRTTFYDWPNDCMVAYIYYNDTTGTAPFVADERHGIVLDWQTHEYLHRTRGASFANGFELSGYVLLGDGSSDAHLQLTLASGTFFDEDLQVDIVATQTPTANTWEQDLLNPARIPMFYHSGTGWVRDNPTDFPVKQGTVRPQYNLYSAGTWSTQDIDNNKFGVTFIVGTNNINYPVIGIMGQNQRDNQTAAESEQFSSLDLTGFPVVELRVLYRLVYDCKTNYSNSPKARFTSIFDLRRESLGGTTISVGSAVDLTNVTSSVVPIADITYDLGTVTNRWRDLYLSGNSLHLGNAVITATGNAIILPAGTVVNGESFGATGATGPAGAIGATGIQGSTGLTGATGPSGAGYDITTSSTGYFALPAGNTAQRPSPGIIGAVRYNSSTGLGEIYTQTGWNSFGAQPPSISSVTPATYNGEAGTVFTVNGTNFANDAIIKFIDNAGNEYTSVVVNIINSSQLTATTPQDFTVAQEPLDVKIIQSTGTFTKLDCIDCGVSPVWQTAAGQLASVEINTTANVSVVAVDSDSGSSITYSLASGSLPLNLTLSNSGVISGTVSNSYSSTTTVNFTLRATDNAGNFADRAFSLQVIMPAPVWTTVSGKLGASTARTGSFSTTVTATTPTGSITGYSVASGSLPTGLSINSSGTISGTISAGTTVQTWNFTLRVTNSHGRTADRAFNIVVIANTISVVYANYYGGCSDSTGGNRYTQFQSVCNGQQSCNFNPLDYGDPQGGTGKNFSIRWTCTAGQNTYECVGSEAGYTRPYSCAN